jgi:NitT/TauT family transport system substrate-binding protein
MSRRRFLLDTGALGIASGLGLLNESRADEPPPEVKTIRVPHTPSICLAPQYLAEALLKLEGFAEVEYIKGENINALDAVIEGKADITMWDAPGTLPFLDAGRPLVLLAGIHAGCYELFASHGIHAIHDLKGKTIAVYRLGQGSHVLVSSILAYVGMNPTKDVNWVAGERAVDAVRMFEDDKADAFIGFPPHPQELRAKKIGHVVLNTTQDRPWSQYFCCMLTANRDFVRKHPVATKRALRAVLKSADLCANDPVRVARFLAERGYETRSDIALEVLTQLPYRRWRDANPEDTIRFLALRLHEAGIIRTAPEKLIFQGTDWRFLNQLKEEMKS